MSRAVSRRQFLKASAASPLVASGLFADEKRAASDRITLGFIGVGTMGRGHLGGHLGDPAVQVLAVCDVVAERRDSAKQMVEDRYSKQAKGSYKGCQVYSDFRDLLARKDIDAVVIATPDHWHTIPCILAARAGKDIYCEKPLTHNVAEGRRIVEEVAKAKVVFQTGSQQRSEFGNRFRTAVELVRNGRIGKVKTVRIGVGGPGVPCNLPTQTVPEGTDWDFWLGPAPERPYNEALCPKGVHHHFPAWRNYREFGGGGLADMGAHHFDIAQWALDMDGSGPVKVEPPAGTATKGLRFTYANGVVMIHDEFEGERADCLFEGETGKVFVSRDKLRTEPADLLQEHQRPTGRDGFIAYPSNDHRKNWLQCVRSRKPTICPAEAGHRSATVCHLGQIGYELRRALTWDPAAEKFVGDDEANRLLTREPREKWRIV